MTSAERQFPTLRKPPALPRSSPMNPPSRNNHSRLSFFVRRLSRCTRYFPHRDCQFFDCRSFARAHAFTKRAAGCHADDRHHQIGRTKIFSSGARSKRNASIRRRDISPNDQSRGFRLPETFRNCGCFIYDLLDSESGVSIERGVT